MSNQTKIDRVVKALKVFGNDLHAGEQITVITQLLKEDPYSFNRLRDEVVSASPGPVKEE